MNPLHENMACMHSLCEFYSTQALVYQTAHIKSRSTK